MGKRIAAAGLAVAIAGGGLTVAAINPLGIAGAQDAPTTTSAPATTGAAKGAKEGPLGRALDDLVADGTLTQAQADKVTSTVKTEVKEGRADRKAHRQERRTELLATVAKAIGTTPEQVKAGLKDGTSIAEQAKAKGVDRQVVDDAVTKALTARIDAAAKAGTLTSEQATKAKAKVGAAVDKLLDADGSHLGKGAGTLRDRIKARRGN